MFPIVPPTCVISAFSRHFRPNPLKFLSLSIVRVKEEGIFVFKFNRKYYQMRIDKKSHRH